MARDSTSGQHASPDRHAGALDRETLARADRIAADLAPLVADSSIAELVAAAVTIAMRDSVHERPGAAYLDQRASGLTRRQWQIRIADGRLRAVKVGRKYMTTPEWLRACVESDPVRPVVESPTVAEPGDDSAEAHLAQMERNGLLTAGAAE